MLEKTGRCGLWLALTLTFFVYGCGSSAQSTRYRTLARALDEAPAPRRIHAPVAPAVDSLFAGEVTLDRAALVTAVLERNPNLLVARESWRAALARYPQQGSLEDPRLSYSFAPLSVAEGGPPFGQSFGLEQRVPFPGKLGLKSDIALAEAEAARGTFDSVRLDLARVASLTYDDYFAVGRALAINAEHRALLDEFVQIAAARYGAGLGSQEEALQAEVEAAHLLHQELQLQALRGRIRARLNALLHRRPDAGLPHSPVDLAAPDRTGESSAALISEAIDSRPELARLKAQLMGRTAAVDLAGREFWPDLALMASYNSMWRETEHQWMVGLSLNLPLRRDRRHAAKDEAEARAASLTGELQAQLDAVALEVESARIRREETADIVDLFRDRLLPASRDRLAAASAEYETGRAAFLSLIEAERNLRDTELGAADALADHHRARADLARAVGRTPTHLKGGR